MLGLASTSTTRLRLRQVNNLTAGKPSIGTLEKLGIVQEGKSSRFNLVFMKGAGKRSHPSVLWAVDFRFAMSVVPGRLHAPPSTTIAGIRPVEAHPVCRAFDPSESRFMPVANPACRTAVAGGRALFVCAADRTAPLLEGDADHRPDFQGALPLELL